ncbi:MAG TPA: Mu-like prophage major head subunit gpT family protein [Pirellulales bacterium]
MSFDSGSTPVSIAASASQGQHNSMGYSATFGAASTSKIEAAICIAGQLPGLEKHFSEQTLEAAHKEYRGRLSIQRLLCEAARANGHQCDAWSVSGDLQNVLRAAFSTTSLPTALGDAANKFVLASFSAVESTWRRLVSPRPVKDFRPTSGYRLTGDMKFEPLSPDGEIKHGRLGESSWTNRAATRARMLGITRHDIINDDGGVFIDLAKALGRGGALAVNDAFWKVFLDNAAFFTALRGNHIEGAGTVLSIDGLTLAEAAFRDQTDENGDPLGMEPRTLLVPNALKATADQLMSSVGLAYGTADGMPTTNPHAGKFRVESSSYLNNPKYPGGSALAWYLLGDPEMLPAVDAVFLGGKQEPTVESADADFHQLGVQFRGYFDFGFALAEHRGGVKSKGAA